MKSTILFVLLCLPLLSSGQIQFEEVTRPDDFNIGAVRKSPSGEYFIQAANDVESIYTSLNGVDWMQTSLPVAHRLYDIQFYTDGTPVMKPQYGDHLIRRNGIWYTMKGQNAFENIQASYIRADTLFVFYLNAFAYSLDKGQTFTPIFSTSEVYSVHKIHLWKSEKHFVLFHTLGGKTLWVFNEGGTKVVNTTVVGPYVTYNDCGDIIFYNESNYHLFKEQDLILEYGATTNIIPGYDNDSDVLSQDGNFYHRDGNTIYKTAGCDLIWEPLVSNSLINFSEELWISHQGDIFLFDSRSDHFTEQANGTNIWEAHEPDINFAFIKHVNESGQEDQISLTPNALFHKKISETNWVELGPIEGFQNQFKLSPGGIIYINRKNDILYSADNGQSFSSIPLPNNGFPLDLYSMEILSDDVLFVTGEILGSSYYTLNRGQDWVFAMVSNSEAPIVKLVDSIILIADLDAGYVITRINLATNDASSNQLGNSSNLFYFGFVIQDDGTIYFQGRDPNNTDSRGLFRYRFGEEVEFIAHFQGLEDLNILGSGTDLFAFDEENYFVFDGNIFREYDYSGLPAQGTREFFLAENDYVYAIINHHKIFRSTLPLAFSQYISGSIYHHQDQDCVVDSLDPALLNWQVRAESDEFLRIITTNSEGHFRFSVPYGEYTLSTQPIHSNWEVCKETFQLTVDEVHTDVQQDFLAKGLANCAELEIDFSTPLLRRCFDNYYSIRVRNSGPEASEGTILTLQLDPFFEFTSATIPYIQLVDNVIKFDLGVLAVSEDIQFKIFFKLSCDATLRAEHCLTGFLSDNHLCAHERSTYTECQMNIGSYDPNDKRVFNEAGIETDGFDKGEYIYYHIRFQNTGTDTAFNISVVDPLSLILDLNTLQMLSASHPYDMIIKDGPELVVSFENILLPDSSSNEPASHGFFKFRIKPLPGYDYGTMIPNQADIYFDYNDPVLTEEATLVIMQPVSTLDADGFIDLTIFPNPVRSELTLTISENDQQRIDSYEIIDQLGKLRMQSVFRNKNSINVSELVPGMYNLILREKGIIMGMKKFVRL